MIRQLKSVVEYLSNKKEFDFNFYVVKVLPNLFKQLGNGNANNTILYAIRDYSGRSLEIDNKEAPSNKLVDEQVNYELSEILSKDGNSPQTKAISSHDYYLSELALRLAKDVENIVKKNAESSRLKGSEFQQLDIDEDEGIKLDFFDRAFKQPHGSIKIGYKINESLDSFFWANFEVAIVPPPAGLYKQGLIKSERKAFSESTERNQNSANRKSEESNHEEEDLEDSGEIDANLKKRVLKQVYSKGEKPARNQQSSSKVKRNFSTTL